MAVKSYNYNHPNTGTNCYYGTSGAPGCSTQTLYSVNEGSMETYSHPHPYVTGGNWLSSKRRSEPGVCNGSYTTDGWKTRREYDNYPIHSPVRNNPPSLAGGKTLNELLARSNPSRPLVSVPNFLFELKDLPSLARVAGRTLKQKGANAYLQYQYGFKPLMDDLASMLTFQDEVDKRLKKLDRLRRRGGFKFTDEIAKASYSTTHAVGNKGPYSITENRTGFARRWGQVSWVFTDLHPSPMNNSDRDRQLAFKAAAGLTVDAFTIWEALPWSWMIDWFGDIGDFLLAHRNIIGMRPGDCYTMTHTEARNVASFKLLPGRISNVTRGPSFEESIVKRRVKGAIVGPTVGMPFLTGFQFSILGALGLQRIKY